MIKVLVYGSLKKGRGNNRLLLNSKFISDFKTKPEFTMFNLGAFPGIVENGNTSITCELWEVNDETMRNLDMLEGYPSFYDRKLLQTPHGPAWIYFLSDSRYREYEVVESGVW